MVIEPFPSHLGQRPPADELKLKKDELKGDLEDLSGKLVDVAGVAEEGLKKAGHEVDTPFAWTETEAEGAPRDAPPIRDYFTRILGWKPRGHRDAEGPVDRP